MSRILSFFTDTDSHDLKSRLVGLLDFITVDQILLNILFIPTEAALPGTCPVLMSGSSHSESMEHVRSQGLSSGWIGPVLQVLGTMKKLDDFKGEAGSLLNIAKPRTRSSSVHEADNEK